MGRLTRALALDWCCQHSTSKFKHHNLEVAGVKLQIANIFRECTHIVEIFEAILYYFSTFRFLSMLLSSSWTSICPHIR